MSSGLLNSRKNKDNGMKLERDEAANEERTIYQWYLLIPRHAMHASTQGVVRKVATGSAHLLVLEEGYLARGPKSLFRFRCTANVTRMKPLIAWCFLVAPVRDAGPNAVLPKRQ